MEYPIANQSPNTSNPNSMIDPQFLQSLRSLQLAEKDYTFNQFGASSSSNVHHNVNQDAMTIMDQPLQNQNSVSDHSNMMNFDLDQRNRGFPAPNKNTPFSTMDSFVPSYHPMGFDQVHNYQSDNVERLNCSVPGSASWLLLNEPYMFQELIGLCEDKRQLSLIVKELFSNSELLIQSMFTKQGSNSVQKLIKKIKYTTHAFKLTELLATRFVDIANHRVAKSVILKCFNVFGNGPNHVLYLELILCHRMLAAHVVGCNTLNDCIDSTSIEYRTVLLECIAKFSDYLSNDPYGNFVVQHVLELRNNVVNDMILEKLKGQFVSLAQKRRGSRVVERCMEASENGLILVVNEMLQNHNSLSLVAKDQSGNYIVQKALNMTKRLGYVELYESLVENLSRQINEIERTPGGRYVISVMKNGMPNAANCSSSY